MRRLCSTAAILLTASALSAAEPDPTRVLEPQQQLEDSRLGKPRTYNDKDFFFKPPTTRAAWEARRQEVRQHVLVALGLWPLPEKTPLNPVIHGKIDRDDYTIEKVFFASYPGHYVSGNLYRPKGKSGKLPGVLCPHGHWANGRFYEALDKTVQDQIAQGAENTPEGARYPLQARCAMLARMGCIVFHYDMVGVADSQPIAHRAGFTDVDAELHLQNFMGLQTWNSIRALDFLLSLPDVDPQRIGITGASGGGTQTFILGALDDRLTVAFPAVMVGTAMQGGCICENCSYLRQSIVNVELAALFAPKPLGMTGADDWTIDIETKGLPELKAVYRLYGVENRVMAKCFPQFKHNYNEVSREVMYNWFNKYLQLGQSEPVVEKPFKPVPPKELSVYDEAHPRPKDALTADRLRQYLTEESDKQMAALYPRDGSSWKEFRRIVGTALSVMIDDHLPASSQVEAILGATELRDGVYYQRLRLGRRGTGEQVPAVLMLPSRGYNGSVVVWVHPQGKASLLKDGKLTEAAARILDSKTAILALDAFRTGESPQAKGPTVDAGFAGYTFGYNRPLLANRVHDILTAVAAARGLSQTKTVHLLGLDAAGPWVILARGLCGDSVARTAVDLHQFRFEMVKSTDDEMMLPGALKYGGLPAFAALCAPGDLFVANWEGSGLKSWLTETYRTANAPDHLAQGAAGEPSMDQAVRWLLR